MEGFGERNNRLVRPLMNRDNENPKIWVAIRIGIEGKSFNGVTTSGDPSDPLGFPHFGSPHTSYFSYKIRRKMTPPWDTVGKKKT